MRSVAEVADVSANQATVVLNRLVRLGLVERRDVGAAALVRLVRENEVALAGSSLGKSASGCLGPSGGGGEEDPAGTHLPGWYSVHSLEEKRDENSDIDVLVVPPPAAKDDGVQWTAALGHRSDRRLGLPAIRAIFSKPRGGLPSLVRRAQEPWRTIVEEGVVLIGAFPSELEVVS